MYWNLKFLQRALKKTSYYIMHFLKNYGTFGATIILVFVTYQYTKSTQEYTRISANLSKTASEQLTLSTIPDVDLYSEFRPYMVRVIDSIMIIPIKNYSNTELIELSVKVKFYYHHIYKSSKEFFIEVDYTRSPFDPNLFIDYMNPGQVDTLRIDLRNYSRFNIGDRGNWYYESEEINGKGEMKYIDIAREDGSLFAILSFKYYRKLDGKKFEKFIYLDAQGGTIIESLYFPNNLKDILSKNRRISAIFQNKAYMDSIDKEMNNLFKTLWK